MTILIGVKALLPLKHPAEIQVSYSRCLRRMNLLALRMDLFDERLADFEVSDNIDKVWDSWSQQIIALLDKHAPVRKRRVGSGRKPCPWASPHLHDLKVKRDKAHRTWLAQPCSSQIKRHHQMLRAEYKKENRRARTNFYRQRISAVQHSSRAAWSLINTVTSRKKTSSPVAEVLLHRLMTILHLL